MREAISAILSLCLAASVFAGCSSSESSKAGDASAATSDGAVTSVLTEAATTAAPEASEPDAPPASDTDNTPLNVPQTPLPSFEAVRKQYEDGSAEIKTSLAALAEEKTAPCINITTQDGKKILSKEKYTACVIDVFNCEESYVLNADCGVKVRGNSTAEQGDEKPYRIKFEDKYNLLGLHGGKEYKSWVLLRSYWNLAPDFTAFSLAETIFEGKYYSSDCMYVNLFINGESRGIYLLCEQNQAADDRIDVYEPAPEETGTDIGYAIEMDNYPSEEHPHFYLDHDNASVTDISGESRRFNDHAYSVKSDINTKGQLDFINKYTYGAFEILYQAAINKRAMMFDSDYKLVSADGTYNSPKEAVEAVFDLESLANMVILEELVHNNDVGAGSFYMAVDFSPESRYKKLTFLAPWDFNWAYEGDADGGYYASTFQKLQHDGYDRSNPWYITAMKADWFRDIVKEKWAKFSESGALKKTTSQVVKECMKLKNDLGSDSWKIDQAKNLVKFVNGRIDWLDEQWLSK
ncbi:MAG: CotH kinase family protein [Ruminococcus sp.]|nr:CotH kinase family protein [Ruminococcus sp.]